jgi:hypothetical protein
LYPAKALFYMACVLEQVTIVISPTHMSNTINIVSEKELPLAIEVLIP